MSEADVSLRGATLRRNKAGLCGHVRELALIPLLLVALVIRACPAGLAQEATSAMDEMRAGVVAYKFSDYAVAADHFRAALAIDPRLTQARLFLATAIAQQYVAGDDTPANVAFALQAIEQYKMVLSDDPSELEEYKALVPLASLSFNLKHLDEAREYYGKAIELKPEEARNYFMVGLIDWTEAYKTRTKVRSDMGLAESAMISRPEACVSLRAQNQQKVEDGIQRLQKALELQPANGEAMGYMNLLYRERAEYECDDPEARKADLKTADGWVDKAFAAKDAQTDKAAAEKPAPKQP
jgi:tetratricopeptide (TPR) repeat protein